MPGHLLSGPVKDEAGIVELLTLRLREAAADHPDLVGSGGIRKGLPNRTACGFGVRSKVFVVIGTTKHLR